VGSNEPTPPQIRPLPRLPSGRHGLPPSFVARNQKERIMAALAQAVASTGYSAMTVEHVIQRAGVSRRTFYDHFSGKEEAFVAAYDGVAAQLQQRVLDAYGAASAGEDQLTACLTAFLLFVASEPEFADMCIVQVLAAGPAAIERRDRIMRQFEAMFDEIGRTLAPDAPPPPLTSEALVGAVYELVYKRVLRDETPALLELLPDLVYACVLPYVGRDAAMERYVALRAAASPPPPADAA
jgi:AcrR family transcriptional regulator